ncbi:MAG: hypothetical protein HY094_06260 [Candidatus Melainabacteria bacterium]|nr:hypothetical protein [Candidatus Melainabacteria bacterium]
MINGLEPVINRKRFYTPVYRHHPDGGQEEPSGGVSSNPATSASKSLGLPKGLTSVEEIVRMFGLAPHALTNKDEGVEILDKQRPWVKKFTSRGKVTGEWVVKLVRLGYDYESRLPLLRREMVTNLIGKTYFSELSISGTKYKPFIFPEQYAYECTVPEESEKSIFLISKYIPSEKDKEHFHSLGPRLRAWSALFPYLYGFGDSDFENMQRVKDTSYPQALGFYHPDAKMFKRTIPSIAMIDTGIVYHDKPRMYTLQSATNDVSSGYAPWVDIKGGNELANYMQEAEPWKERIDDQNFQEELFQLFAQRGISREEAEKFLNDVVKENFKNYEHNLELLCAAANKQIPATILKRVKWETGPKQVEDVKSKQEIKMQVGTKFFLDLNNGFLVFVEVGSGRRVSGKVIDLNQEFYLDTNMSEQITFGSKDGLCKDTRIAPAHVMLYYKGKERESLVVENLQRYSPRARQPIKIWY